MRVFSILCAFAVLAVGGLANAEMLPTLRSTEVIEGRAVAVAGNVLTLNQRTIYLFGINAPPSNPQQAAAARQALDALLTKGPIRCNAMRSWFRGVLATCNASDGGDLAVALLRAGAVTVFPSQALASPVEAPYIAAENIAREANVGLWGATTRPSSNSQEALDKVAVALATPPDPVPMNSLLWYLYPWQSAIAGLFGLIGAAFVLIAAKYSVESQSKIIDKQFKDQKIQYAREREEKRLGLLYSIRRECKVLRREAGVIMFFLEKFNIDSAPDTKIKQGAKEVFLTFTGKFSIKCPKKLIIDSSDVPIIGIRVVTRIESIVDKVDYYEEWYGRASLVFHENSSIETHKKNINIVLKRSKEIYEEINSFMKHLNEAISQSKKALGSDD